MKVLLISTLIGVYTSGSPSVSQDHIWFTGPSAFSDCTQVEAAKHSGDVTVIDGKKTSKVDITTSGNYRTYRETKCMRMSE